MTADADYWREVALYLASVHGATAEKLMMTKATSQGERRRQVEICKVALDMIDGKMHKRAATEKFVRERLMSVISSASETDGKK